MIELNELRRLAQAVTPGPWRAQHPFDGERGWEVAERTGLEQICAGLTSTRAAFIAAANPAVVLELLDEIERLQQDASRYQFIRAGGAYVEPSDNSLYVALDERGKYYDDRRDLDMDIDEAIATQRGE